MQVSSYSADLYGCKASLDDADALTALLYQAAERIGATVVAESKVSFQPHGVTAVLVLAESHILIATWPEYDYANLDVFLCNPAMKPEHAGDTVIEALQPTSTRVARTPHWIGRIEDAPLESK